MPFPSPGDLPNPGIKPRSPALQADSLPAELPGKPIKQASYYIYVFEELKKIIFKAYLQNLSRSLQIIFQRTKWKFWRGRAQ